METSEMYTDICGGNVKESLVNLRRKWQYIIKMYLRKKQDERTLTASMWLRVGSGGELLCTRS